MTLKRTTIPEQMRRSREIAELAVRLHEDWARRFAEWQQLAGPQASDVGAVTQAVSVVLVVTAEHIYDLRQLTSTLRSQINAQQNQIDELIRGRIPQT